MPRRGENIRKRADGRWEARYFMIPAPVDYYSNIIFNRFTILMGYMKILSFLLLMILSESVFCPNKTACKSCRRPRKSRSMISLSYIMFVREVSSSALRERNGLLQSAVLSLGRKE